VAFIHKDTRYTGKCSQHPNYSEGRWLNNDFALCKFSPKAQLPIYGSLKAKTLSLGDTIVMQGYGAGSKGVLNVGTGPIFRVESWQYLTQGRLQLGGGDSGGALFANMDDLKKGPFIVVGINSRKSRSTSMFNRTDLAVSQRLV
jgi:hypothetical protein